jgi:hypothetical protein
LDFILIYLSILDLTKFETDFFQLINQWVNYQSINLEIINLRSKLLGKKKLVFASSSIKINTNAEAAPLGNCKSLTLNKYF